MPCWKASSLCRGIRRSCPSSTRLYLVLAGMSLLSRSTLRNVKDKKNERKSFDVENYLSSDGPCRFLVFFTQHNFCQGKNPSLSLLTLLKKSSSSHAHFPFKNKNKAFRWQVGLFFRSWILLQSSQLKQSEYPASWPRPCPATSRQRHNRKPHIPLRRHWLEEQFSFPTRIQHAPPSASVIGQCSTELIWTLNVRTNC